MNGLSILDAQGKVAFTWKGIGAVWRLYMTVSWSPDSQRVMLLDQFGRTIQIQDHFLVHDKDTHREDAEMAHWEDATAILQFSNGSLRLVN